MNLQNCTEGLDKIEYDLKNIEKWEHFLLGEPLKWREAPSTATIMDQEDEYLRQTFDEKHLDMPSPWSMRIYLPHEGTYFF